MNSLHALLLTALLTACGQSTGYAPAGGATSACSDTDTKGDFRRFLPEYRKRTYAHGAFTIASHGTVSDEAHARAKYTIERMITPQQADELEALNSWLFIVGDDEYFTDSPGFRHLACQTTSYGGDWNANDGAGGTPQRPATVVTERHLIQGPKDQHYGENILVHELSHHMMGIWASAKRPDLFAAIEAAYQEAKASGAYTDGSYALSNSAEYFAEGAQVFFNATQREDAASTGGMTHAKLPGSDPGLFATLSAIYTQPWDCRADASYRCYAGAP